MEVGGIVIIDTGIDPEDVEEVMAEIGEVTLSSGVHRQTLKMLQ